MTSSRIGNVDRMRLLGAVAVLIGVIGLSIYPYHMYYHYEVPGVWSPHVPLVNLSLILWPVWASMIAWGLAAIATAKIRSLTPAWAALATIFVAVPAAMETYREPVTDVVPAPSHIQNWTPPAGLLDLVARTLAETYFVLLGSTLFLLLGVAWARGQRGWLAAGLIALPIYGGIHDVVEPAISGGFVLSPLRAAIPGAVLFYAGYRLAAGQNSDDTVARRTDAGVESPSD